MVFLLDVSDSMIEIQREVAAGARLAMYDLRPEDRVALMTFSSRVKVNLSFTANTNQIADAFFKATRLVIEDRRGVRLYDAILTALAQFPYEEVAAHKRVVIVITNDVDAASMHSATEVVREANAKKTTVSVILAANPNPSRIDDSVNPLVRTHPYPNVNFAGEQLRPMVIGTGGQISIRRVTGYLLRELTSKWAEVVK